VSRTKKAIGAATGNHRSTNTNKNASILTGAGYLVKAAN
jgi:hypothetical protein